MKKMIKTTWVITIMLLFLGFIVILVHENIINLDHEKVYCVSILILIFIIWFLLIFNFNSCSQKDHLARRLKDAIESSNNKITQREQQLSHINNELLQWKECALRVDPQLEEKIKTAMHNDGVI